MRRVKKRPISRRKSNKKFKKGMKLHKLNVRVPTRGGTRL